MIEILYTELNCDDQSILKIIYLVKSILNIARIAIPIILIILCMWDGIKNTASQSGWDSKIINKMIKRFIAAAFVFLVPLILNFVLNILGENGYEVGSCWNEATKEGIDSAALSEIGDSKSIRKGAEAVVEARKKLQEEWGKES